METEKPVITTIVPVGCGHPVSARTHVGHARGASHAHVTVRRAVPGLGDACTRDNK